MPSTQSFCHKFLDQLEYYLLSSIIKWSLLPMTVCYLEQPKIPKPMKATKICNVKLSSVKLQFWWFICSRDYTRITWRERSSPLGGLLTCSNRFWWDLNWHSMVQALHLLSTTLKPWWMSCLLDNVFYPNISHNSQKHCLSLIFIQIWNKMKQTTLYLDVIEFSCPISHH